MPHPLQPLLMAFVLSTATLWGGQEPSSLWEGSLSYAGRWSTGGLDHWVLLDGLRRIHRHWAIPVGMSTQIGNLGFDAAAGLRWFPTGKLSRYGYEDWLQFQGGKLWMKVPWGSENDRQFRSAPYISLAYGRDIQPWPKAPLGLRLSLDFAYVLGEVLSRDVSGNDDMPTQSGNIILSLHIGGILW
ncbi:MAG TPA: hypothetical protein VLM37_07145 [Fibrobacteraceae bacterium]|nr:hypothetical protein [Fibrobacteraceae bacterium]